MFSIIVAVGKNNEIGYNNKMLWYIKDELEHFKNTTLNHTVIFGRKTYESINKKLIDRNVITLSRSNDIKFSDILKKYLNTEEEIFICGGSEIYSLFLPYVDRIYISYINKSYPYADRYFEFDYDDFKLIKEEKHKEYMFKLYERKKMKKNFYITTPIYYPNAKPHVGTAYSTLIADVIARYKRLDGYNVRFITGTDEHGQKIQEAAIKNNVSPKEWVDRMCLNFKDMWDKMNIKYDYFVRTTNENHEKLVQEILKKSYDNGDIYKGYYIGKYCVSEETFVTDSQLIDGKYMGKEVIEVQEESYFFRLSKYQDKLLEIIENNKDFIVPSNRKNEIISFIKQGLQDLSISRTSFTWGIPLEFDKNHVVYVWFDALNSYLTGSLDMKYWNNSETVHILGKDILRFHAIIWPAMLLSAGIELPKKIVAHGWWTANNEKMSKSLGNVVDPYEEIENYGLDAFRYFLLRESNFASDADYSKNAMIQRINSDLANDLGNLLNRTLSMVNKYLDGQISYSGADNDLDISITKFYEEIKEEVKKYYEEYNLSEVLKSIWKYISRLNKYIDENEIWNLAKDKNNMERLNNTLYHLLDGLYKVSSLIYPFMPETSKKMNEQLGLNINFENESSLDISYPKISKIGESYVLFPRIELPKLEYDEIDIKNPITIEDFDKVNIKVCKILKVYDVENTSFLRFIIDTGTEKRQVMSNIKKFYSSFEELIGKNVLAVLNLKEVEIKGYISQGMILTISEKKKNQLIFVNDNVKLGTNIK